MTAPTTSRAARAALVLALLVTGLSMRTAVTSVGAVLDDLQDDLHASGGAAGLITTMPVLCFAAFGAATPRLARALGPHRLLVVALAVTTVGLATRPFAGGVALFVVVSTAALAGSAVSNVLMPSLVKLHFPDRIGTMTALYTTALAVGVTAAAGLTVPIGEAGDGWRQGLAAWAVVSAVAVVPWLPTVAADRRARATTLAGPVAPTGPDAAGSAAPPARAVPMSALLRSRTAWALTVFFGTQSMQAYITFGWFARFLTDHGIESGTAGAMLAVLTALSIPVSLVVPRIPARHHRAVVGLFVVCLATAYVLMAAAPRPTAWIWVVLAGVGGGSFPLLLTLLGMRARTADTIATLSAFVQAIGYLIAGTGPLLFGALYGVTGSWALPIAVLFTALGVMTVASRRSTTPRFVDDELAASPR
ncbi:MFS transporter, CP family, cyanate transporter [Jatrophihabitans endophyticus]|uniref:MFS transporter, CP family, cyanate transporter n=1 Tax=Jatrophihabitans endophyticus TaxID=1206085 RepID=A0A1M5RB06_9ACTN|nr:MFS transporter [Jatrophihabitans endophyticus]SHH23259.1 MFS transporter, CP family, cyanate transporter [Jatrophihabitans endophyticus]